MKNFFTKMVCAFLLCNFAVQVSAAIDFDLNEKSLVVCPTIADINLPITIEISDDTVELATANTTLSPDSLVANFGFTTAEAFVTWDDPDQCNNLALTWADQNFDLGNGNFKIIREWTVVDWDLSETTNHFQIIRNTFGSGNYCVGVVSISVNPWDCSAFVNSTNALAPGFNYENLVMDPPEGTALEIGIFDVLISGTVAGEDFQCTTTYNVLDNTPPVPVAFQDVQISLDSDCIAVITPAMIDNGSHDGDCGGVTLSVSPDTLTVADAGETVIVTLTVTDEAGNTNLTWSTVTVSECGTGSSSLACIAFSVAGPLQNDGIQLYPEDFLADTIGVSDDLSIEITDEDGNVIPDAYIPALSYGTFFYTVTDNATGNSCWGTLNIPLPFLPCTFLSCNSNVFLSLDANSSVTIGPEDLSNSLADCPGLTVTIADEDNNFITSGAEVTLTQAGSYFYTISNTDGNSCWGNLTIGDYVPCPANLACNDFINASMSSSMGGAPTATITSDMLLEGNTTGCDIDSYEIVLNDTGVAGYNFSGIGSVLVDEPSIYTYTITDPVTGNSCWGSISIEIIGECNTLADVSIPADIDLAITGLTDTNLQSTLTPENLQNNLGFLYNEVYPSWPFYTCDNLFSTYDDLVIDLGEGSYKVIRTWTVLDWLTAELISEVQIIQNIVFPGIICDFLPNSAPLGDCDSGHTDEDDVEWPDDLNNIADFRISPDELALYSGVDPADTKPVFVNNAGEYTVEYIDILNQLEVNEMTVCRVWTVYANATIVANYSQKLIIDISNFNSLVSVSTMFNRPIPDVELNTGIFTNGSGVAFVNQDGAIELNKPDDPHNGITIRDLVFMQQHILGVRDFNNFQLLAGDTNLDDRVSAIDLVQTIKTIISATPNGFNDGWFFLDYTDSIEHTIQPKANYFGIKRGDVDDDAFLGDPIDREEGIMILNDVLINNGESYETKLQYEGDELSLGVEIHMYYDENLITIDELYLENSNLTFDYNIAIPGEIHLSIFSTANSAFLFADENLINIKFTANSNGLLSQAIENNSARNSYLLGIDYELVNLNIQIGEPISTGIDATDIHNELFKVYPNPATDLVNFDFIDNVPAEFTIQLFNTSGQLVSQNKNQASIDVNELSSGMYMYQLIAEGQAYSGLLSIIK